MIDYIQNTKITNDDNVLNLNTERFFREAEDDFFYFNKTNKAISKLQAGLELSPCHVKSMKFLGDIFFSTGKMTKAFDMYAQAAALKPEDTSVLASLASACEALGKYKISLEYVNLAFKYMTEDDAMLFAPLSDLKVSLLVKLQKYTEAKKVLETAKKILPIEEAEKIARTSHDVLSRKLSLKERMENLNIKVV